MYIAGLIDISLWDKANWKSTVYGYSNDPSIPPFVGIGFENFETGKEIFKRWKAHLGDVDINELIKISFIEGEIEGEPDGYSVFIGTNQKATLEYAKAKGLEVDRYILTMGRFHRMTPAPESQNLSNFKYQYNKHGQYLLLPAIMSDQGVKPFYELGICKKKANFLRVDDLVENDLEYAVLKKSKGWSGKDSKILEAITSKSEKLTPERITETIAIFETELAAGVNKKTFDPMIVDSLASLKYDDNGLIIPDSVNPLLIAAAEEVKHGVIEREARRIPLINIQKRYVEFLEYYFSEPYSEMLKNGLTPHQMAGIMSSDGKYVRTWQEMAPEMLKSLQQHWKTASIITSSHLRKMPSLKAVYGGNIFPHPQSNLVCNASLYIDTLILPDPIFNSLSMTDCLTPQKFTYLLAKNALTAMTYKDWAVVDIDIPLVVFVPDYFFLSDQLRMIVDIISQSDLLSHLQHIFNYPFASYEDAKIYFEQAPNIESIAASVKNKDRFVFDIEELPLPLDQLEVIKDTIIPNSKLSPKLQVLRGFCGRFLQANNTLAHCDLYGGVPIIDAPTSWQYFLWKLEYSISQLIPEITRDTLVAHVLHEELRNIPIFSKISVEGAIELRKSGKISGLREIFRKGIGQISNVDGNSVNDVTKQVLKNLREALQDYETQINEIPKDILSISGQTITVAGNVGLGIAAAATGSIPLAIFATLAGSAGFPTAKDIIKKGRDIYEKYKHIKNNPVGLFWKI